MKATLLYGIAGLAVLAIAVGIGVYALRGSGSDAGSGAVRASADTPVAAPAAAPVAAQIAARIASGGRPTLIELGMNSCASCKAMHRVLDELRATHGEALQIVAVDIREQPELVAALGVVAIPTQVLLDGEGREIARHVGFYSADAIRERFAALGLPLGTVAGTP